MNYKLACLLALAGYPTMVTKDQTTKGESIFLAQCLLIPNTMAQGITPDGAELELYAARVDMIESYLDDGLPVPFPGGWELVRKVSDG